MSLVKNTSWSAAGTVTISLGRMAVAVALARRLGPSSFGRFVFLQWVIEVGFLVCSAGLSGVATRFLPQSVGPHATPIPGFTGWFLKAGGLAVLLTSGVATLSAVAFMGIRQGWPAAAIGLWASSYSTWALLGARAQGLFQFERSAASAAAFVAVALIGLTLPWPGEVFSKSIVVLACANGAACLCIVKNLGGDLRSAGTDRLTSTQTTLIYAYARNAWTTSVLGSLVWGRGEMPLVKGHLGQQAVGYYSVSLTISGIINQALSLITGALWPQIARGWDGGDRADLLRFSTVVTNVLMLVAAVSAGFVVCFSPYIVTLLFGPAFLPSATVVTILAVGALGLSSGSASLVLQAATNGTFGRNIGIGAGIAMFAAAFILIPTLGITGGAVARSGVQLGVALVTFARLGQVVGQTSQVRHDLRSFVLLVGLTTGLAIFRNALQPSFMILCAAFAVFVGGMYAICAPRWRGGLIHDVRHLAGASHA